MSIIQYTGDTSDTPEQLNNFVITVDGVLRDANGYIVGDQGSWVGGRYTLQQILDHYEVAGNQVYVNGDLVYPPLNPAGPLQSGGDAGTPPPLNPAGSLQPVANECHDSGCQYGCNSSLTACNPAPASPSNPPGGATGTATNPGSPVPTNSECNRGQTFVAGVWEMTFGCPTGYVSDQPLGNPIAGVSRCNCSGTAPATPSTGGTSAGTTPGGSALDPLTSLGTSLGTILDYLPMIIMATVVVAVLGMFGGRR
jgi:hypothetical protein